ncbi:flagellar brake protein [Sediminispirochaeta bajacaliforniensis]|uniref:flagellar brake protein n=1 Tax=Sediminispirochaeta bajacaliforniensis TaxID=148 RepID=UPI00037D61AF|nr:PilZ domain-containing protein [Sediminispirochaeta bajacaliforniensis]
MNWTILAVVCGLIFLLIALIRRAGGGSFPWIHFYVKGKEAGFSFREVNLLRRIAVEARLKNPTSLFWSIGQLDRSIRGVVTKFRSQNLMDDFNASQFLLKLFNFRRQVELNLPKYKLGLKSSRKIMQRQRIKISLPGAGTFDSQVVENLRRYLAVSYPEGPKLAPGFLWKGQLIQVYFWRVDDAGYTFESRVLEDYSEKQYPILHISHSDSLIRSQKRNSVRVEVRKPAWIYPLSSLDHADEVAEARKGLRARLEDLSEDGAAVRIGGKGKVGMNVKIQFSLADRTIVMNGTVRGVNYNTKTNQSLLHIQALPLSPPARNRVLVFVYNLFGERDMDSKQQTTARRATALS